MSASAAAPHPLVAAARRFGREVIEPGAEQWNEDGGVPREFFQAAAAAGLCSLLVPAERGGAGLDMRDFAAVLTALAAHCMHASFALVVHNNLAAAIARQGSDAQRGRYLDDMLAGRCIGAFLLTEPGAGSDAAAIGTTARAADGGWILDGSKAWVTNAALADVMSVYAQTAPGAGARGIAAFLVDGASAGLTRKPGYRLFGGHALAAAEVQLDGVGVAAEALMVAPGEGFAAAMRGIDIARIGVAAMCSGMLARALAEASDYAAARPAFGRTVADFQGVQWMLADAATALEAMRALTARAAALLDAGEDATLAAAHAKKFATRAAFEHIAACMQVMGAAGLKREFPLARLLEGAKVAQYLDGATEIQNVVIARRLGEAYGGAAAYSA